MKQLIFVFLLILCACKTNTSTEQYKSDIEKIMNLQVEAWNNYDLEGFMQPYWQSDSMRFMGKRGLNYGWQTTLDNYKKGYPDPSAMGTLEFDILSIEKIENEHALVIGKWTIYRNDTISGHYSLIWKKIDGEWKIIVDHSS